MAKQKMFEVPVQDATPLRVLPGLGMPSAANEDVPLRERPPIVEAPGLMITFNRSGILITGVMLAALTAWCATRVFLFAAWLLGLGSLDHHFSALGGFSSVLKSISGFLFVLSMLVGALFAWVQYNRVRFHGPDRRRAPRPITDEKLAAHYDLPANLLWRWQFARHLIARHDERGVVTGAESEVGTWIRDKDQALHIIKQNTFDILYLTARSKMWRMKANEKPVDTRV